MKTYTVRSYYMESVEVEVDAIDEDEARVKGTHMIEAMTSEEFAKASTGPQFDETVVEKSEGNDEERSG